MNFTQQPKPSTPSEEINHDQSGDNSLFEDNTEIEYLAFDEFGILEEDTFNEFCASLQFDPYHPEGENEIINQLVGKRKRETFEDKNSASYDLLNSHDYSSTVVDSNEGSPRQTTRKIADSNSDVLSYSSFSGNASVTETTASTKKGRGGGRKEGSRPAKIRIPLKDIRRSFPYLFARAFNTCDGDIIAHCLQRHCVPECVCIYKYVGAMSPYGPDNIQVIGVEAISEFWNVLFLSMPDAVFEIQENKLRVLQNGSCACVSKYIFCATKVFKLSTDEDHSSVVYKQSSSARDELGNNNAKDGGPASPERTMKEDSKIIVKKVLKSDVLASDQQLENSLHDNSLNHSTAVAPTSEPIVTDPTLMKSSNFGLGESLEKPQVLIIIGTFTVFVNPDKKIYKFEFIHSIKS